MSRPLARTGAEQLVGAVGVEEERDPAVGDLQRSARRPSGRSRRGRSGCRPAAGGSAASAACPGRCPRPGSWNSSPSYSSAPSRASALRTISTYSRVRETGRANEHAVPALRHLRARHAEAEPEAAVGEGVERGGGHGGHRGRARGDLEQPRAEADPLGHRADVPEHGGRVLAPRLGDPHRVEALAGRRASPARSAPRGSTRASRRGRGRSARCNPMRGAQGGSHSRRRRWPSRRPRRDAWTPDMRVGARVRRSSARATCRSRCARPAAPTATAPARRCARRAW